MWSIIEILLNLYKVLGAPSISDASPTSAGHAPTIADTASEIMSKLYAYHQSRVVR